MIEQFTSVTLNESYMDNELRLQSIRMLLKNPPKKEAIGPQIICIVILSLFLMPSVYALKKIVDIASFEDHGSLYSSNYLLPVQNQTILKSNLGLYLEKFSRKRLDLVKIFKEANGFCNGLTILWLYSKWIDTQNIGKYNSNWFKTTVEAIANWNGEDKIDEQISEDIEQFAELIALFQFPEIKYQSTTLNDMVNLISLSGLETNGKTLRCIHTIKIYTKSELENFLSSFTYNDDLVYITYKCGNSIHAAGMFKHDENYYYYDSNQSNGETSQHTVDKIISSIISSSICNNDHAPPITFTIYSFSDIEHSYSAKYEFSPQMFPGSSSDFVDCGFWSEEFCCHGTCLTIIDDTQAIERKMRPTLIRAVREGNLEGLKAFLSKFPLSNVDFMGPDERWTPLMHACFLGYAEHARVLLEYGADVNFGYYQATPLLLAVNHRDLIQAYQLVKVLLDRKAKIDYCIKPEGHESCDTALTIAAARGDIEIVELLLKRGADVNHKDERGWTALEYAYESCNLKMIRLLLEKGSDPFIKTNIGNTFIQNIVLFDNVSKKLGHDNTCYLGVELIKAYAFRNRVETLRDQIPESRLAWIVDRNLNIKPMLDKVYNFRIQNDYIPWPTQPGSLLKHIGIKFYNGTIYSYSDDSRVLESKDRGSKDPFQHYGNRQLLGGHEIACDAEIMDKAIIISRMAWDRTGEYWSGNLYDVMTNNCYDYVSWTLDLYMAMEGRLYLNPRPMCLFMQD